MAEILCMQCVRQNEENWVSTFEILVFNLKLSRKECFPTTFERKLVQQCSLRPFTCIPTCFSVTTTLFRLFKKYVDAIFYKPLIINCLSGWRPSILMQLGPILSIVLKNVSNSFEVMLSRHFWSISLDLFELFFNWPNHRLNLRFLLFCKRWSESGH